MMKTKLLVIRANHRVARLFWKRNEDSDVIIGVMTDGKTVDDQ